jgi:hypothetical protein
MKPSLQILLSRILSTFTFADSLFTLITFYELYAENPMVTTNRNNNLAENVLVEH